MHNFRLEVQRLISLPDEMSFTAVAFAVSFEMP